MDVVSEVLADRARELGGIERMLGASVVAHVALIGIFVFGPSGWWSRGKQDREAVMTISLTSGVEGPIKGMTPMDARPVQALAEASKRIEPVRPPAAKAPEMIEPTKTAPKRSETKTENAAKNPSSRTPTKGSELRQGSAVAETGARGQGFGLAQGGFGATGSYLETANFCCPEYLAAMDSAIRRNWDSRQRTTARTAMKFTIQRDGTITDIALERSSGYQTLDFLAQRALMLTRQLPPLPGSYPEQSLTVHLVFEYQ
jgi:protein TonB